MSTKRKLPPPIAPALPVIPAIPAVSAFSWFTQATIVVALVTIIGYCCVLSFEAGFLSYFYIPYYWVSLNPIVILGTLGLWVDILVLLCGISILASILTLLIKSLLDKIRK